MEMTEPAALQPQQYQRLYWEEDVPLADVRKSVLRKFVYIAGALCILYLTIGLFVTFPDQVELPFVIRSNQSEEIYRFSQPVYVIEKYIKPNDTLAKGQRLLRITSPEIVSLVTAYREAEHHFKNFSAQKVLSVEKQKMVVENRIRQNNSHVSSLKKGLSILDSTWKSNRTEAEYENEATLKRYQEMKKLYDDHASSKFELMEYEAKNNKAVDVLESGKQNYNKTKLNITTLTNQYLLDNNAAKEELQKINFDLQYDSASLYNLYLSAKSKIESNFGNFELDNNDLILIAGETGIVSYIFDGDKEVLNGSILLKVMHNSPALYAMVKSPPSQIGKFTINKKVVLKVASFPFYEWGAVQGHIENMSLTPDETGNYSVKISLDSYGQLKSLLQIGMNGDAAIILEEKTFYHYFFRKVKKAYYEATQ